MTSKTAKTPLKTAKEKAEETVSAVKGRADEIGKEAQTTVRRAAETAKAETLAKGNAAKDSVAGQVDDTAAALLKAAEQMTDGSPQAEAVERAAYRISEAASTLRSRDIVTLGEDVADLARKHPTAFVAAAALLGFAAGRFMRSSAPTPVAESTVPNRPALPQSVTEV